LATAVDDSGTGTVVNLTFVGGAVDFGSLQDGRYTLTVSASQVSNVNGPLDGDGDGTGGDDFVLVGDPTVAPKLYRLFGDVDGSGANDAFDFLAFRLTSGQSIGNPLYNAAFDFEGDGDVDAQDFLRFRDRFGIGI
jgi:hypothetical protein